METGDLFALIVCSAFFGTVPVARRMFRSGEQPFGRGGARCRNGTFTRRRNLNDITSLLAFAVLIGLWWRLAMLLLIGPV